MNPSLHPIDGTEKSINEKKKNAEKNESEIASLFFRSAVFPYSDVGNGRILLD